MPLKGWAMPITMEKRRLNVAELLTPEQIVGAIVWTVAQGEVTPELRDLAARLPDRYIPEGSEETDIDVLIGMVVGGNYSDIPALTTLLQDELEGIIKRWQE